MRTIAALITIFVAAAQLPAADARFEFFEQKIRPALVQHCYECHSADAKKLKGGLRLDTRQGVLAGGDSGPAIVPHKSAESLLIKVLHHNGDVKMPPQGKLPASVIADFEKWITLGAADPRDGQATTKAGMSIAEGKAFWSYRPVARTAPPKLDDPWPANDIDRFILQRLNRARLKPAADADPATLVRRLYFDLIGLPPTPEQLDAYLNDHRPEAYERLVDQLLASPGFGERWGRHWLDVVRYAESVTLRGFVIPDAWRYRDYVIAAFNADKPFDAFIREQIAGDLLPAGDWRTQRERLAAVQFLLLGNINLEEQDKKQLVMDIVDEQLDVITKGFLAQTVTCARCHDHKFDPIPTADYYALAGILANVQTVEHANVSKWLETKLPVDAATAARAKETDARIAALAAKLKEAKAKSGSVAVKEIIPASAVPGSTVDDAQAKAVGSWTHSTHSGHFIGAGYHHDAGKSKGEMTLTFLPELPATGKYEVWFAYSHGKSRDKTVPLTILSVEGEKVVHVDETKEPTIDHRFVSLGTFEFEKGNQGYVIVSNEGTTGIVTADAVVFVAPGQAPPRKANVDVAKLQAELDRLKAAGPVRESVVGLHEADKIADLRIHIRGSGANLGPSVPRGMLQVACSDKTPVMPADASGRLELANWIADQENPLTSRVIVNRAWHWLFGAGLVRTVDNFGTTGETPSHPELLDHLAGQFVRDGWSMKKLVKSIVMSRTYRQSSRADANTLARDADNRLLARANARRLDAECIRDAMASAAGRLSHKPVAAYPRSLTSDYGYRHQSDTHRSIYLPVFRNTLPPIFEAFDFADPSMVVGARNTSTVAPQALFMLNHPSVRLQARALAERVRAEKLAGGDAVTRLYRLTLGRPPTSGELQTVRDADLEALAHALFASVEFRYVK